MNDWWIWSSVNLRDWTHEATVSPEHTYIGRPFSDCWATDAVCVNDTYYWYFSGGPQEIGVMASDTPVGPWLDPLGMPLISKDTVATEARDPGILLDDDGSAYLVFGTWDFYIARLDDTMVSLAEQPRAVIFDHREGPYGAGKTDDKPYLHTYRGLYYLSWGCFYAVSDSVYGPYRYCGSILQPDHIAPEFRCDHYLFDRHGSFFMMNGQWYFMYNDFSQPGTTPFFRDSCLSYVHYRENGEIAPVVLDRLGVGQYDATAQAIQAACFTRAHGIEKHERCDGSFIITHMHTGDSLEFSQVQSLCGNALFSVTASSAHPEGGSIEVYSGSVDGQLLGVCQVPATGSWDKYQQSSCRLSNTPGTHDLHLVFTGRGGNLFRLESFQFTAEESDLLGNDSPPVLSRL